MADNEKPIALFVPTFAIEECLNEVRECLEVGWTGLGFKTVQFEKEWSAYTGTAHSHFVNSATAGLQLAIRAYKEVKGWENGDEVITTPLTFVSTNHVIVQEGLKPVFADVDKTLCLDPQSIEKRITSKTRAVIFVGMGGNAGRLADVAELCKRKNLCLILDAAHMAGTRYRGKPVGQQVECAVYSFQAVKNLPTGDSGMICFSDPALDALVRKLSWLGINKDTYARSQGNGYKWDYQVDYVGYKFHGNAIMAGIGIAQLRHLEAGNTRRRQIVARYENGLKQEGGLSFIEHLADCESSRHLFQVRTARRDELIDCLASRKINPGVHYRANTRFTMYRYGLGTCPEAERADQELISLPLHLRLSDDDVGRVIEEVRAFYGHRKQKAA